MSFSFEVLVTACRIRSTAWGTVPRPCVRPVLWSCGFPLVDVLPSGSSAGACAPLFAAFFGTMTSSDCFTSYIFRSDYLLSSAAPVRLPGQSEALPSPNAGLTHVPELLRHRGALTPLTLPVRQVLSSALRRTSTLQISDFSVLNRSARTHRYRRFAYTLTDARARLTARCGG